MTDRNQHRNKTLEQHWIGFHEAVKHTIVSEDQRMTMKVCYYAGVRAMMAICIDAFPDFGRLTSHQKKLMRRSIEEAKASYREFDEFAQDREPTPPETKH